MRKINNENNRWSPYIVEQCSWIISVLEKYT